MQTVSLLSAISRVNVVDLSKLGQLLAAVPPWMLLEPHHGGIFVLFHAARQKVNSSRDGRQDKTICGRNAFHLSFLVSRTQVNAISYHLADATIGKKDAVCSLHAAASSNIDVSIFIRGGWFSGQPDALTRPACQVHNVIRSSRFLGPWLSSIHQAFHAGV